MVFSPFLCSNSIGEYQVKRAGLLQTTQKNTIHQNKLVYLQYNFRALFVEWISDH